MNVIDLFAGAGGWDLGARDLGLDPLGIEWMPEACRTREAAGLRTLEADIAELDPEDYPCKGLIASPPCQAYSMAGKGAGRRDVDHVVACTKDLADGVDARGEYAELCEDERSILVVEPLRWALALRPRWLAFEQVPPALPLWELFADILRERGYHCWTGVLSAERYGVPQTRKRAFLLASLDGPVHPPEPTHQEYVPGEPAKPAEADLFGDGLLPWVSMAQALGWEEGPSPSPSPSVTGGGGASGGVEVFASKAARARAADAVVMTHETPRSNEAIRSADQPAPTLTGGSSAAERVWTTERPAPTIVTTRRSDEGIIVGRQLPPGEGRNVGGHGWNPRQNGTTIRPSGDPAPAVLGEGLAKGVPVWDDSDATPPASGPNAIRVTQREAAILQTFPPDYPWQGSRSRQFLQIGNAVPPVMARAVLEAVLGR